MLRFARQAEEAGLDSVWCLDRLVFNNHDPLLSLAAAAAITRRVRLGTSVLLATLRPPALLAKMVATLDQLSGGRMTLGIGVGSRSDDFAAAEVPFEHRGSRADELVRVLELAWSGRPVRHRGRFFSIDVGPIGPRPAQQPRPPIWFGGSADSALRRVGRIADGYIGSSSGGPEGFRANWDKVRQAAEAAGRDPASITPAALVWACVDDDRASAVAMAERYFAHYYPSGRRVSSGADLTGPADACVRGANAYFKAGVQHLIVGIVSADPRYLDRFCEHVLPRLDRG
jgi:probable F420-dependent oxidoreductase